MLSHAPVLEYPIFNGIQTAEGVAPLGDELTYPVHHVLDWHARHLHLLQIGMQEGPAAAILMAL